MLNYDGDLQMVIDEPKPLDYKKLMFLAYLVGQGKLNDDIGKDDLERATWNAYVNSEDF